MRPVSVYRIDSVRKTKIRIGTVIERRRHSDRGDNLQGLLYLARKTFASSPQEALLIAVDWQEARAAQGI